MYFFMKMHLLLTTHLCISNERVERHWIVCAFITMERINTSYAMSLTRGQALGDLLMYLAAVIIVDTNLTDKEKVARVCINGRKVMLQ